MPLLRNLERMIVAAHSDRILVWDTSNLRPPHDLGSLRAEIHIPLCVKQFVASGGRIAYSREIDICRWELSVWNIDKNEMTAQFELDGSSLFYQLNNSGDRIMLWTASRLLNMEGTLTKC